MLSNSDPKNNDPNDEFFDELYNGFSIERVPAKRFINCDASKRGEINEIIVRNYKRVFMVKYDVLGFKNEIQYLDYFFKTLLPTNRTYNYYVDWEKVKGNVIKYLNEISLLNSLTKIDLEEREKKLIEIISRYPEVIPVIPLIIAIREKNIVVLDIGVQLFYKEFKFNENLKNAEITDIVEFSKKSGILDLFGEINDLYAYLLGMEVGLDSNARKNRSGKIFEHLIGLLLKNKLRNHPGFS